MHGKACFRGIVFTLTWAVLAVARSQGVIITLSDLNSVSHFDTGSQAGQFDWNVDGVNQLAQQWFWYRIGPNGPEQSLDTLDPAPVIHQANAANFDATYTGAPIQVKTLFSLAGGSVGSGTSDLAERVRITNLGADPLEVHFFEYVNFDLNGIASGDSVQWANSNTVLQQKGTTSLAETVDTTNGAAFTHREVNVAPNTLNALNDAVPTTLNDNLGAIGPADVTWAFQWDFVIPAGSTALISKDKNLIVPEPATIAFLVLGAALGFQRARSR